MAADRAAPWSRWDGFQGLVYCGLDRPVVVCVFPQFAQMLALPARENSAKSVLTPPAKKLRNLQPTKEKNFAVSVTENPALSRPFYDNGQGFAPGQQLNLPYEPIRLLEEHVNTIDPSYYDCIYQTANTAFNVTQLCGKDLGCCSRDCCKDTDWSVKYGWAVALIVVFCILVILAVVITLVIWLLNRAKDKQQKRQLLHGSGLSPATSQMSLARPIHGGYHFGTGPYQNPPDGGYRY